MNDRIPMFVSGRLMERAGTVKDEGTASLLLIASELLREADAILRLADADIAEWREMNGTADVAYDEDIRSLIEEYLTGGGAG